MKTHVKIEQQWRVCESSERIRGEIFRNRFCFLHVTTSWRMQSKQHSNLLPSMKRFKIVRAQASMIFNKQFKQDEVKAINRKMDLIDSISKSYSIKCCNFEVFQGKVSGKEVRFDIVQSSDIDINKSLVYLFSQRFSEFPPLREIRQVQICLGNL